jgi:hypothetical protein|nr:MAG TPA: hypothetical protein [Caudoviricetes sp.]
MSEPQAYLGIRQSVTSERQIMALGSKRMMGESKENALTKRSI